MKAWTRLLKHLLPAGEDRHHPLFLRQPPRFSRAILWTIMLTTLAVILWAALAHIDEVVAAQGRLKPTGKVREVQTPVSGVVAEFLVSDGDQVREGQVLAKLDQHAAEADVRSLRSRLAALREEKSFYDMLFSDPDGTMKLVSNEKLSKEIRLLVKDGAEILSENKLLEAQIKFSDAGVTLTPERKRFFDTSEKDRHERLHQVQLAAEAAEKQLEAATSQSAFAKKLVENSQTVMDSYSVLVESESISKVEYLARQGDLIRNQTQLQSLVDSKLRLQVEIDRAREAERNVNTSYAKEAMARLNDNGKSLAGIDARLSRLRLDAAQQISQIESQLAASEAILDHHLIKAPQAGVIFDMQFNKPGAVVQASQTLLKIVPGEELVAEVDIPNRDIGFIHSGMNAEVRVDSFPFREFGQIAGTVSLVGPDALAPTSIRPYAAFPTTISLARQTVGSAARPLRIQSGMAVTVNIHIRKRSVISLFVDFLLKPVDNLEEIR